MERTAATSKRAVMARAKVTLGVGKTVKVSVDKMGVTTDSIYRIQEETGKQPGEPSLNYQQSFTAEFVAPLPTAP